MHERYGCLTIGARRGSAATGARAPVRIRPRKPKPLFLMLLRLAVAGIVYLGRRRPSAAELLSIDEYSGTISADIMLQTYGDSLEPSNCTS